MIKRVKGFLIMTLGTWAFLSVFLLALGTFEYLKNYAPDAIQLGMVIYVAVASIGTGLFYSLYYCSEV